MFIRVLDVAWILYITSPLAIFFAIYVQLKLAKKEKIATRSTALYAKPTLLVKMTCVVREMLLFQKMYMH